MSDHERRPCDDCGERYPRERMHEIDITPEDDYYPSFIYICPTCWRSTVAETEQSD